MNKADTVFAFCGSESREATSECVRGLTLKKRSHMAYHFSPTLYPIPNTGDVKEVGLACKLGDPFPALREFTV